MEHPLNNVITWLEAGANADYRTGVLLLQEHGGRRTLVNLLLRKESTSNREKLRYELVKIGCQGRLQDVAEVLNHFAQNVQGAVPLPVNAEDVAPSPDFASKATAPAEQPAPEAVTEAVKADVDAITQLMQGLYNHRCQLSNGLADLPEGEGPRVVGDILCLQNQYNALAEKRRRLVAGEPVAPEQPAAEAAPVIDRAQLAKDRQNLRSNLSKTKGKLAKAASEAKKAELEQKIAQMGVELAHLDMQLALPQA
ncbi:hypothetical protein [Hymenobacter negativus]|uniref:Uncharacterized protein n=1 Tax=Hymenobacter negativus TaxID=2795026 RepID=A0ABS3Q8H9_9BACT|nr:hypothetical protein [Hymenobacter negativus]MBO2007556.1 hypothetical protein [Hymenobacter negativus]